MTKSRTKRILIVAGEASGDLHGASLAAELKRAAERGTEVHDVIQ